jgi:hypothetical protein
MQPKAFPKFPWIGTCEPKFSDVFPRLVTSYHPRDFHNPTAFKTEFRSNPLAEMIADLARVYHLDRKIQASQWFTCNNDITPEIRQERQKKKRQDQARQAREVRKREQARVETLLENAGGSFEPLHAVNPFGAPVLECPLCHHKSGSALFITHHFTCPYRYAVPIGGILEKDYRAKPRNSRIMQNTGF